PRQLQRFQREARSAARLHHTNIVPVHGVGEDNGLHYFVMQYIQGLGLDEVLVELKRLRQPKGTAADGEDAGERARHSSAAAVAQSLLSDQFADPPPPDPLAPEGPGGEASPPSPRRGESSSLHLPGQTDPSSLAESGRPYWRSVARVG